MAKQNEEIHPLTAAFESPTEIEDIFRRAVKEALARQAESDAARAKTTGGPRKTGTAASPAAK